MNPDSSALLDETGYGERFDALRRAETIGRPVGDARFMRMAEPKTGRALAPAKRGPKPKLRTGQSN